MTIRRYILALAALVTGLAAWAQDFNPDTPPEPGAAYRLQVVADPAEAATVTGGGAYFANKSVPVIATPTDPSWVLVNWTNSAGAEVGKTLTLNYRTTAKNETLTAHFTRKATAALTLSVSPASAADPTGAGTYAEGTTVSIGLNNVQSNFTFKGWQKDDGTVVSTSRSFSYVTTVQDTHLTAVFEFTPNTPAEPSATVAKHHVYLLSDPAGGSFNQNSGFLVEEGASYSVYAYSFNSFTFEKWTIDGEVVGTNATYSSTMGNADVYLTAHYAFNPAAPDEPGAATGSAATVYGLSAHVYRGLKALYPIYLENTADVYALDFAIDVPAGLTLDPSSLQGTSRLYGYSIATASEPLGGDSLRYTLHVSGGAKITGTNGKIMDVPFVVGDSLPDGDHLLTIGHASAMAADSSWTQAGCRSALLTVETVDESGLLAQFATDRFMNRVAFTNHSTPQAVSFEWDFGDGTTSTEPSPLHTYAQPGSYEVSLTARGIVLWNTATQTITIEPAASWTASGQFTLDAHGQGLRNFVSADEMATMLGQCTPEGELSVEVASDQVYVGQASATDYAALANRLAAANSMLCLTAPAGATAQINLVGSLPQSFALLLHTRTQGVTTQVDGYATDLAVLREAKGQTVCSGEETEAVAYTTIYIGDGASPYTISYTPRSTMATGYAEAGTGNLPAMTLTHHADTTVSVIYDVEVKAGSTLAYAYAYPIGVRPTLQGRTLALTAPADSAKVMYGEVTLRWQNMGEAASCYILNVKAEKNGAQVLNLCDTLASTSRTVDAIAGARYVWSVEAIGACSNLVSNEQLFTVREKADLTVTELSAPERARSAKPMNVEATVKNISSEATVSNRWVDALYWSTQPNDFDHAQLLVTREHYGQLAAGESYQVSFTVQCPDDTNETAVYYLVTDYNNHEAETNEDNNRGESLPVALAANYIDSLDLASLRLLHQQTGGNGWVRKWDTTTDVVRAGNWTGVTFDDDGHVTTLNLQANDLKGELPAEGFVLPRVKNIWLSNNYLTGDAAKFVGALDSLQSLSLGYNELTQLSAPIASRIDLSIGYQHVGDNRLAAMPRQVWPLARTLADVVPTTLMTYDHEAQTFGHCPDFYIYASNGQYIGYLTYADSIYHLDMQDYQQPSGAEVRLGSVNGTAQGSLLRGVFTYEMGDADIDGMIAATDVQATIMRCFKEYVGPFNVSAADTYPDERINVQDVVATTNILLADTATLARHRWQEQRTTAAEACVYIDNGYVVLRSTVPVAVIDVKATGSITWTLPHNSGMTLAVRASNMVGYSLTGGTLPAGETIIGTCNGSAALSRVTLADAQARAISVAIGNQTITGMEQISAPKSPDSKAVYDLMGRKVNRVQKGVFIMDGRKAVR